MFDQWGVTEGRGGAAGIWYKLGSWTPHRKTLHLRGQARHHSAACNTGLGNEPAGVFSRAGGVQVPWRLTVHGGYGQLRQQWPLGSAHIIQGLAGKLRQDEGCPVHIRIVVFQLNLFHLLVCPLPQGLQEVGAWIFAAQDEANLGSPGEVHGNPLAWIIPWTEEPGRVQFMGSQRVKYDWNYSARMEEHTWSQFGCWGRWGWCTKRSPCPERVICKTTSISLMKSRFSH